MLAQASCLDLYFSNSFEQFTRIHVLYFKEEVLPTESFPIFPFDKSFALAQWQLMNVITIDHVEFSQHEHTILRRH